MPQTTIRDFKIRSFNAGGKRFLTVTVNLLLPIAEIRFGDPEIIGRLANAHLSA